MKAKDIIELVRDLCGGDLDAEVKAAGDGQIAIAQSNGWCILQVPRIDETFMPEAVTTISLDGEEIASSVSKT